MNWQSFFTGAFFALCAVIALFLTMPASGIHWRKCAPAQAGEQIKSTVQYEDHTDCFYTKTKKVPSRKVRS